MSKFWCSRQKISNTAEIP